MYRFIKCRRISVASCTAVNNIAVGSSVNYEVRIGQENGGALSGIKFFGVPALENTATDGTGKLAFSTSQIGVDANALISLIPYSTEYQFIPSKINISPNSCANNICKITAFKNGSGQGVVKWQIKNAFSEPAAGINLSGSDAYICPNNEPEITNQQGYAYFPSVVRSSCNMSDSSIFNDLMSFNAQQTGCTFTHNSQTAFQICPTENVFNAEMSMHCSTDGPLNFQISGKVFNTDGMPLKDAKIINNSLQVGMTDQNGNYSLTVDRNTYSKLEVQFQDLMFDPALTGIDKIASDFQDINFYGVAPDRTFDGGPGEPGGQCPVKSQYTISGFITTQDGDPLPGVTVYNNYIEKTVSDLSGYYSFTASPGESLW